YLSNPAKTFDLVQFYNLHMNPTQQAWVFAAFFLAFAIKIPLFPFHTWQPDTYTEAPSAGSMLLAGIMLKMGLYGVFRWLLPNAPIGFRQLMFNSTSVFINWENIVIVLCLIGIVYGSIIAFTQKD